MNQALMVHRLQDLQLPAIRYIQSIDSTNDEAWRWVEAGAPHAALVVADEQTAGRGRQNRHWVTAPGSALAFSLVLRPPAITASSVSRLVGLAALAVCQSLQAGFSLHPEIKWPNDILLDHRKAAGILVESRWEGERLSAVVVGIGINIAPDSVNPRYLQPSELNFPAICVEEIVGQPVDRWEQLHGVLRAFLSRLPGIALPSFIDEWQAWLAYRGEWVTISQVQTGGGTADSAVSQTGKLVGLAADGSLILAAETGELVTIAAGEMQLRPGHIPGGLEMHDDV